MTHPHRLLLAFALVAFSASAWANIVWPALYLETRLLTGWAVSLGIVVEAAAIMGIYRVRALTALGWSMAANAASTIVGVLGIPLIGLGWELFPGSIINWAAGWGTFNPVTWTATVLLAATANALVEGSALRQFFKARFRGKEFLWLALANLISVLVAFGSILQKPVQL